MPDEAPAKILEIWPEVIGIRVRLECPRCRAVGEYFQISLTGMPIGVHPCGACAAPLGVLPEAFLHALDTWLPSCPPEVITELTTAASDIAESWYQAPEIDAVLRHADVRLGPPTERELLSFISLGLYREYAQTRGRT